MESEYSFDYGLPFVPATVRKIKPMVLVDVETHTHYRCLYEQGRKLISGKGRTPIEAMQKWAEQFTKIFPQLT